jgi:ABC-type lipoprotein release transport system permease subunit
MSPTSNRSSPAARGNAPLNRAALLLGARRCDPLLTWIVLRHGLSVTGLGLLVGAPLSILAAGVLSPLTAETGNLALTTAIIAVAMLCLIVLACGMPMRRALRVEPAMTLRSE